MDVEFYTWTLAALACSTLLSAEVWRNPIMLSPIGSPLTVFNVVAPLSVFCFLVWGVAGFFLYDDWKAPITGYIVGVILSLFFGSLTRSRGIVYTPAVLAGCIGIAMMLTHLAHIFF